MQVQTQQCVASTSAVAQNPVMLKKAKPVKLVERLNRVNLRTFIVEQDGKFVSVDFKKIGSGTRTLTGRLGVKAYLKGGQNNVEADSRPYLTMFDIQLREYRTVSLDTVSEIRASGRIYQVID